MIIERIKHSGALELSLTIVGEGASKYLYTRTYYGFTQAQALKLFKLELTKEGE